jgi:hypothetical protein
MDTSSYSRLGSAQPSYRGSAPASTVRRSEWDRRDPHGFIRMGLVFVGAFVGRFVVWPMIRPVIVGNSSPVYSGTPREPVGNHTGIAPDGYSAPPQDTADQLPPARHGRR